MASWAREQAELLRQREQRINKERDWQRLKIEVLPGKASTLWKRLAGCLERDVLDFNEALNNDAALCFVVSKWSLRVTIRRTHYPDVRLEIKFNSTENCIEFERIITRTTESEPVQNEGRYRIDLDESAEAHFLNAKGDPVLPEELSRTLLQAIFSL